MKKFKIGCLGFFIFFVICGIIGAVSSRDNTNSDVNTAIPIIFDCTSISKLSSADLIAKLGEPESKEPWVYKTETKSSDFITYTYTINNVLYEFILADDHVVRLTLTNDSDTPFQYSKNNKEDILASFNVKPSQDSKVTADTGYAYRVSPVNDLVQDFWVIDMDDTSQTFTMLKVTYDKTYF